MGDGGSSGYIQMKLCSRKVPQGSRQGPGEAASAVLLKVARDLWHSLTHLLTSSRHPDNLKFLALESHFSGPDKAAKRSK